MNRKAEVNPRTPSASRFRKPGRSARSVWSASGLPALSGSRAVSRSERNGPLSMNRPPVGRGSRRAAVPSTMTRLARRLALPGSRSPGMALGPRELARNPAARSRVPMAGRRMRRGGGPVDGDRVERHAEVRHWTPREKFTRLWTRRWTVRFLALLLLGVKSKSMNGASWTEGCLSVRGAPR